MNWAVSVRRGVRTGLEVLWDLAKVIVPATVVIHVLDRSGWLGHLSDWLSPLMGIFGLPGESALALVSANLVNFYAGLGVLVALGLSAREKTILAAMIMLSHSAIQETALVAKAGARARWVVAARTAAMFAVALVLNWVLP